MPEQVVPIRSSTQQFIEIEDIDHDMVMYVDGSCCLVIQTTAVNFGLLSEKEQESLIYTYAGLLNSLTFPVQLIIRSQHKDISSYLQLLDEAIAKQTNPKMSASIKSYKSFVASTVKERNVLDKKFYIIIPFSTFELGVSPGVLVGSKKRGLPYPKKYIYEKALTILSPKKDHLIRLLARLGLRAELLTNERLVKFFFTIYNPSTTAPNDETVAQYINSKRDKAPG